MADDLTPTNPPAPVANVLPEPVTTTAVAPNLVPTEPAVVAAPSVTPPSAPPVPVAQPVPAVPVLPEPVVVEPSVETPSEPVVPVASPAPLANDSAFPPADATAPIDPVAQSAEDASEDDKKSPLEILEEILAGANAEQDVKNKEEEEKKRKEAEEKAAFEAKKQVFAQQAEVKMAETKTALQEAAAVRDQVEADIKEKDKNLPGELSDEFEINQLTHDTIQTTE